MSDSAPLGLAHLGAVRAYLSLAERDPEVRADIEAEVALLASRGASARVESPRAYLVGVAAHLLKAHRRAVKRTRGLIEGLEPVTVSVGDDVEAAADRRTELAAVAKAMGKLSEAHQEALRLVAVDELDTRTAARRQGVNEATFRTRLFWARRTLERLLNRPSPSKRSRASVAVLTLAAASAFALITSHLTWLLLPSPPGGTPVIDVRSTRIGGGATPSARASPAGSAMPAVETVVLVDPRPVANAPRAARPSRAAAAASTGERGSDDAEKTREPTTEVPPPPPSSNAAVDALVHYDAALTRYQAHDFAGAAAEWTSFLDLADEGPLRTEARLRRAESWARLGQCARARAELDALRSDLTQPGLAYDANAVVNLCADSP